MNPIADTPPLSPALAERLPTRRRFLHYASWSLMGLFLSGAAPANAATNSARSENLVSFPLGYYTFPEIAQRLAPAPDVKVRCDRALRSKVALLSLKPRPRTAILDLLEQGLDLTLERQKDESLVLVRTPDSVTQESAARERFCAYLNRVFGGPFQTLFPFQGTEIARLDEALPQWEAALTTERIPDPLRATPIGLKLAGVVATRWQSADKAPSPDAAGRDAVWLDVAQDFVEGVKRGRGALALAALWRNGQGAPGLKRIERALATRRVVEVSPANAALNRLLRPEMDAGLDQIIFGLDLPYYGDVGAYAFEPHLVVCSPEREQAPLSQWMRPLLPRDATLIKAALGAEAGQTWEAEDKATALILRGPQGKARFRIVNRNYPLRDLKFCHLLEDWARGGDQEIIAEQYPALQKAAFFAGGDVVRNLTEIFSVVTLKDYPAKTPRYPSLRVPAGAVREEPIITASLREAFAALTTSPTAGVANNDSVSRNPLTLRESEGVLLVKNRWAFVDRAISFPDAALLQLERQNPTDGLDYNSYFTYYATVTPIEDALWQRFSIGEAPRSLLSTATLSQLRIFYDALLALPPEERNRILAPLPPGQPPREYSGAASALGSAVIRRIIEYCALCEPGWGGRLQRPDAPRQLGEESFRFTSGSHLGRLRRLLFVIQGGGYNILGGGDFLPDTTPGTPPAPLT